MINLSELQIQPFEQINIQIILVLNNFVILVHVICFEIMKKNI